MPWQPIYANDQIKNPYHKKFTNSPNSFLSYILISYFSNISLATIILSPSVDTIKWSSKEIWEWGTYHLFYPPGMILYIFFHNNYIVDCLFYFLVWLPTSYSCYLRYLEMYPVLSWHLVPSSTPYDLAQEHMLTKLLWHKPHSELLQKHGEKRLAILFET